MKYDYIIVGAGSAGCILASRLSESGKYTVLLLEAGGKDNALYFKVPVGYVNTYYNQNCNWMYYTQPEKELNNRSIYTPRGKVQGGSGSINAMIYIRGQASDFDDWAAKGNPGWSFTDVLPYFKKLESHPLGNTKFHSAEGPIKITQMKPYAHPICNNFLVACKEQGFLLNDDFNGASIEGAGVYDINARNGMRDSSSTAYLRPAIKRDNLFIEYNVLAQRVLIDEYKNAIGVEVVQNGACVSFYASKEVILSAGAINTPKLLQLSGVADKELLQQHGIELQLHLPAVGKNLQDHLCTSYYYKANRKTLNDDFGNWYGKIKAGIQYVFNRKGPLALSVNQAGGFLKGSPEEKFANIQLYFNPLSYEIPKDTHASLKPEPYSGFLMVFAPCRPTSRGTVEIASKHPLDPPKIRPNYLSTEKDIDEVKQGSRLVRKLMQAQSLKEITISEVKPGESVMDDESMLQYFKESAGSIYHLCGSCAMGPDPETSVVGTDLKVHGLKRLRIVDASIFPNITSGNINAPTMMVAEKGAAMILHDAES